MFHAKIIKFLAGLTKELSIKITRKIVKCEESFFLMEYDSNSGYFCIYKISLFEYLFNFTKNVSLQTKFSFKCLVWVKKEIFLMQNKEGENLVKEIVTKNNWETIFESLSI